MKYQVEINQPEQVIKKLLARTKSKSINEYLNKRVLEDIVKLIG